MCGVSNYVDVNPGYWTKRNQSFSKISRCGAGEECCEWAGQKEEQMKVY